MVMRGTCEDDRYHTHVFKCLFSLKLEVCMQRLALLIHGVFCVSNTKIIVPLFERSDIKYTRCMH